MSTSIQDGVVGSFQLSFSNKQVGGPRRPREEADLANMILCRPFRDSIRSLSLPGTSVPGSGLSRPGGTGSVASISLSGPGQR